MKRLAEFIRSYVWLAWFALCVLPLVVAEDCGAQKPPVIRLMRPDSIVAYSQPAIYATWWREIAECEGLESFPDITPLVHFFEVKAPDFLVVGVGSVLGATFPLDGQIFIATPFLWDKRLVEHEMMHILLWLNGYNFGEYHPAEFFDVCGLKPWGS